MKLLSLEISEGRLAEVEAFIEDKNEINKIWVTVGRRKDGTGHSIPLIRLNILKEEDKKQE